VNFQIPKRTRGEQVKQTFTRPQRMMLAGFVHSGGYDLFLEMGLFECVKFETELQNTPNGMRDEVLAAHAVSQAAWMFFQRLQNRVEAEINALEEPEPDGEGGDEVLEP
jgi:hypothetical protein